MADSNFASFVARIAKATTWDDIQGLCQSLNRLYVNGIITAKELSELDLMIVDRFDNADAE